MRCFVALGLDPAPGAGLAPTLDGLAARFPELSVPPPQNLHLTLVFLGELDDAEVGRAERATSSAAGEVGGPWTVAWGSTGAFPSLGRARILWLGLDDPAPATRARAKVVERLREAGLAVEDRRFRPHLTLARLRRDLPRERAGELQRALAEVQPPPPSVVRSLVLYRSRLGQGSPSRYEEIRVAPLA